MNQRLILASGSEIRAKMLQNAGIALEILPAKVDESAIKSALLAEAAQPRDVADVLAEAKARRVSLKNPGQLVLGADQVLDFEGAIFDKPETHDQSRKQLISLRNKSHRLYSAAVLFENGQPVWRHIGVATLTMRDFSDDFLDKYIAENGNNLFTTVGGYKIEEQGVQLFSSIKGDYFSILGLPLLELLAVLRQKGYFDE
ncbi:MAG: Maf family protein [Rhodobacteraceae bacterium]|nr:Maf family protein [Paracoccaceae bacterium]